MSYTTDINDYTFTLSLDGSDDVNSSMLLKICAINNTNLKDYVTFVDNSRCIETNLIPNVISLYRTFVDGFNKVSSDINLVVEFKEKYIMCNLNIKKCNIEDSINLYLYLNNNVKNLTIIDCQINKLNTKFEKVDENTKLINELFKMMKSLTDRIKYLEDGTKDIVDYITIPGCVNVHINYHKDAYFTTDNIFLDGKTIKLELNAKNNLSDNILHKITQLHSQTNQYEEVDVKRLYNTLDTNKYLHLFTKMQSLTSITIICCNIQDLSFFTNNTKLSQLCISGCTNITDISRVLQFPELTILRIGNCLNIKNLHILEDHPSLEELQVHKNININVFTKNINFKITILK